MVANPRQGSVYWLPFRIGFTQSPQSLLKGTYSSQRPWCRPMMQRPMRQNARTWRRWSSMIPRRSSFRYEHNCPLKRRKSWLNFSKGILACLHRTPAMLQELTQPSSATISTLTRPSLPKSSHPSAYQESILMRSETR